jgi:A/G-specific adenine glycosylase
VRGLCRWFAENARELPWRAVGSEGRRDPYHALVAEIMLQQTQALRVAERFGRFIEAFPTVEALARAPQDLVLQHWSGLGYYARARRLHEAAQEITRRFGAVPSDPALLIQLPGVGRYTAGAVASIVFNQATPIVDGNVTRVLLRLEGQDLDPKHSATVAACWERAEALVTTAGHSRSPGVGPGVFNEAMMELGATVCTPRTPDCPACPLARDCRAKIFGRQREIPRPTAAGPRRELHVASLLIADAQGRLLVRQRPPRGLWAGLWEPPGVEGPKPIAKSVLAQNFGLATRAIIRHNAFTWETTHRSVRFRVYVARVVPARIEGCVWVGPDDLGRLALGTPQLRILRSRLAGA